MQGIRFTRRHGRPLVGVTVLAAVALLATFLVAGCGSASSSGGGQTPSSAGITIIRPADFSVSDYAGAPLVVNFFGSWCGPCNAEAADLGAFAAANPEAKFVGIAVDDSEEDASAFMAKYGLTYPLVIDDHSLASSYAITGVPTTIFFDGHGTEKDRIVGSASQEMFTASLAKAQ